MENRKVTKKINHHRKYQKRCNTRSWKSLSKKQQIIYTHNESTWKLTFYKMSKKQVVRVLKRIEKATWIKEEVLTSVGWNTSRMGTSINPKEIN